VTTVDPTVVDPFATVVGQAGAVAQMRAASRAPVHAYLLVGGRGSGKRSLARAFAAALLSAGLDVEGAERAVTLALASQHPDLHVFERAGAAISVAQADDIIREASRAPVEGSRKVLVLVDFHLVREVGPKLLKSIEEPSPTTVFVVLAELVPPELVTIASRCVRIDLGVLTAPEIAAALQASGVTAEQAVEVAAAAGGDLERARLLATDQRFSVRREAWWRVPEQLDGTGATVWRLTGQLRAAIDDAQAAVDAQHKAELAELDARVERYGERGSGRRDLGERQRREVRRHRTDELRFGLATLTARYRRALDDPGVRGSRAAPVLASLDTLLATNEALVRNPNEALLLQALLLALVPVPPA
jgi:DNA polymerase III subunit delta'